MTEIHKITPAIEIASCCAIPKQYPLAVDKNK